MCDAHGATGQGHLQGTETTHEHREGPGHGHSHGPSLKRAVVVPPGPGLVSSLVPSLVPSRRAFLAGVGGAFVAAAAAPYVGASRAAAAAVGPAPAPAVLPSGLTAYRAAMHVHGSFSEGTGSWAQHFSEAARTGVSILVPTDHDWRVMQRNYGGVFHFSGLTEPTASGQYALVQRDTRDLAAGSGGTLVAEPAPADTTAGAGALHLVVGSAGALDALAAYEIDADDSSIDLNGTVIGRTLRLWCQLTSASTPDAYLAIQLALSRDPVNGLKTLTYRARTDITTRSMTVQGPDAIVDVPVTAGQWTEIVADLAADVDDAWPDLGRGDCGLHQVMLLGRSTSTSVVDGLLSFFSITTDPSYDPGSSLGLVLAPLRAAYPDLLVPVGLEHSVDQHLGQVGGSRFFYDYPPDTSAHQQLDDTVTSDQVAKIKAHGGVAVYNHPFGTTNTSPTGVARDQRVLQIMRRALDKKLFGADAVEVGYASRGMDLAGHLELWDCLSANGLVYTGVGCSDDHDGDDWLSQTNRFVTLPLAPALGGWHLRSALWRGRAAVGVLGDFTGGIDLSLNQKAYQGSVSIDPVDPADVIVVEGAGLPDGASVELLWGPVDMGGTGFMRPAVVATVAASDVSAGPVSVPATQGDAGYYRANVVAADGSVVAFTNPVYRAPGGAAWVPPGRQVGA